MRFLALGGAREIGASSYLLSIDDRNILLDAGLRSIRDLDNPSPPFPDFDAAERVDAICISHAHLDHIGALPIAARKFREAFCFMTIPTFPLASIMLNDVAMRLEEGFDYVTHHLHPGLTQQAVERLPERIMAVKFKQPFQPFPGERLTITYRSAGHILGAGGILIEGEEGTAFFTGDFTLTPQRTVPAADFITEGVDLLITETTYGNKRHGDRTGQEEHFITAAAETIRRGGKVLVPTFALGRAQEVLLIIQEAQAEERLPAVPVFVDGMVRDVCSHYEAMIQSDLFFGRDTPAPIVRVDKPATRKRIPSSDPCIIVSSSGQLIGGPSVGYAMQLLPDPKNLVMIVSYQDEESPGRRLLKLKSGDTIWLDDERVKIASRIERVQLSAHADGDQLVHLARRANPRSIIGVHGEARAGEAFAANLAAAGYTGNVWIPSNGEEFDPFANKNKNAR